MPAPPNPPTPDALREGPFSFYPAIVNVEHNEWLLRKSTWSEILVANCKTGTEIWISRRFLGEISRTDEPVMIVGLTKELEYKAGSVWPYERRILEMPRTANHGRQKLEPVGEPPKGARGMRFERGPESRVGRLIGAALLLGILISVLVVALSRRTVDYRAIEQSELGLGAEDDYHAVVRKLGAPEEDRWRGGAGELQYRLLGYPARSYFVILMGTDRESAHYIGAMDRNWKPIAFVELPGGGTTLAMLRGLKRF